ncbi:DNA-binding NarL/FixJ family response regulator [Mucilaginibacter sp. SG538B]|uniref:sigma factor-like helix-turn-helix DNA-binding protein n=1 Tax=Mucilaginibacter sp. SG538B TaxID=2587021 RepID=UPI00159D32EA|nr:sigma factor-like helix-turn-helix DNA-binding protein [Mucilaginibacter sp. SG538B]NVM66892.1 DNA-binding NarL/FixJ family response regulator [Mucilaginibacter sp. SG538B]
MSWQLAGLSEIKDRLNEKDMQQMLELGIAFARTLPEVFVVSRQGHLSNKEIAERMGISIKTVETQMTIALKSLRLSMGATCFGPVSSSRLYSCESLFSSTFSRIKV